MSEFKRKPLTEHEIEMNQFDDCTNMKTTNAGYEIECKLGLWSVSCFKLSEFHKATMEALYYWRQYKDDGEYSSIIGGKNVIETLLEKREEE